MINVLVLKNWTEPDLFRQSANGSGIWQDIRFVTDASANYDYVIVLSDVSRETKVNTYKENIWLVQQEPPNEFFKTLGYPNRIYYRVFTTDQTLTGERITHSQPALPWHINKNYDELKSSKIPKKYWQLSWITSLKSDFAGHKKRLNFLPKVRNQLSCDIIGTYDYYRKVMKDKEKEKIEKDLKTQGYNRMVDGKWDGLVPYKYTIVVENFSGTNYWSEKLADSFLAFSMPLYYGCTNITGYFPKDSLVEIDIEDPNVIGQIKKITQSNLWEKNLEKIKYARDLILEKYQFFPYFAQQIKEWEKKYKGTSRVKDTFIIPKQNSLWRQIINKIKRGIY